VTFCEGTVDGYWPDFESDDRPTHHCARNSEEGESTRDMTLASQTIMRWSLQDWSHAAGSDHELIEREYNVDNPQEGDHVEVIG